MIVHKHTSLKQKTASLSRFEKNMLESPLNYFTLLNKVFSGLSEALQKWVTIL